MNRDLNEHEYNFLRQIGEGIADTCVLHALVPNTDDDSPKRVDFACGADPADPRPAPLRATYVMDNVTCPLCWKALRARTSRGSQEE